MASEKDKSVALVMMTVITAFGAVAERWRDTNPDEQASEELAEHIRRALKGIHSDNTLSDAEELRAVETSLAVFEAMLKPQLFVGYTGNGPKPNF